MKKIFILSLIIIFGLTLCKCDIFYDLIKDEWNTYKMQYNRTYEEGSVEENYRFKIFVSNLKKINRHNEKYEMGIETFKMGINRFTDMLGYEVESTLCGVNGAELEKDWKNDDDSVTYIPPENNILQEYNWVDKGAVTEVKDQGDCGAGWAFSATGALEGRYYLVNKTLISLSEQNLIDCSYNFGIRGCKFGTPKLALIYLKNSTGIMTESDYPYVGHDDQVCKFNVKQVKVKCKGFGKIKRFNEIKLRDAVGNLGPISVGIQVTDKFKAYKEGIFYDSSCAKPTKYVNHAVLIVGYGMDKVADQKYWLVKNSWGKGWGMNGYIKMARDKNNNCNIAAFPIYALV